MITNIFKTTEDDLMQFSHDNFQSYPEEFDEYSFEHLDLFYEENFQLSLCSDFDKCEDMVHLNKDTCDKVFHLPSFPLYSKYISNTQG
jgi:hypothetical protein